MEDISYREYRIEDYIFINRLRNDCADFLHNPTKFSLENTANWLKERIDSKKLPWFIIKLDGEDIGYIRLENYDGDIFIGMDIDEKYRGKGLSQRVYKEFIPFIYNFTQKDELWLEVIKTNYRAIHIYEKLGFKLIKARMIPRGDFETVSLTYKLKKEWFNIG